MSMCLCMCSMQVHQIFVVWGVHIVLFEGFWMSRMWWTGTLISSVTDWLRQWANLGVEATTEWLWRCGLESHSRHEWKRDLSRKKNPQLSLAAAVYSQPNRITLWPFVAPYYYENKYSDVKLRYIYMMHSLTSRSQLSWTFTYGTCKNSLLT